jgi:hypothetical protein
LTGLDPPRLLPVALAIFNRLSGLIYPDLP